MEKGQIMFYDILAGIFYFLHRAGNELGSRTDLHKKIYKLKQNNDFSLLDIFHFSTDGIFPVSDEIENSLFSLHLSNIIFFRNPYYAFIGLEQESVDTIKRDIFKNKLSKNEIEQLRKIAIAYNKLSGEIDVPTISGTSR